jgi:hypothetical protein
MVSSTGVKRAAFTAARNVPGEPSSSVLVTV